MATVVLAVLATTSGLAAADVLPYHPGIVSLYILNDDRRPEPGAEPVRVVPATSSVPGPSDPGASEPGSPEPDPAGAGSAPVGPAATPPDAGSAPVGASPGHVSAPPQAGPASGGAVPGAPAEEQGQGGGGDGPGQPSGTSGPGQPTGNPGNRNGKPSVNGNGNPGVSGNANPGRHSNANVGGNSNWNGNAPGRSQSVPPRAGWERLGAVSAEPIGGTTSPGRVGVDGKQFACDGRRFSFRGVTYGTFRPRDDGARFPERQQVKRDFESMREAGFTVVRTYTLPPDDVVDVAADWSLRLLSDVFFLDWRYLVGTNWRDRRRVVRQARTEVRAAARRLAGSSQILALSLGNEIPADVVRWMGTRVVAGAIDELIDVVREEDPEQLVTYANYPTAEYLPLRGLDFLTFNVFLEDQADFRRYLTRLQHLAGDRPLVLGEVGLDAGTDAGGEVRQAEVVDWQLGTALERGVAGTCVYSWTDDWWVGESAVEGWHFGITRADRSPRPALNAAARWNTRTVADIDDRWPSISVVICAYNAGSTLDECLRHTCALEYPDLEIIVVDDGSTDRTAEIARGHPRARLVSIEHAGLSVARNAGLAAASGQIVAYLDSDAYPTPEWLYYLALGMDGSSVAGVGGPNLPPVEDPLGAQQVARAPGGPVHVMLSDDRAEHVPGCNMAFWKQVLEEVGGFDPVYTAAGDDVDVCWKILDRAWEIGFHPAAVVWHHRRSGTRTYLRQQRGYGRAEALVAVRHPNRFGPLGTARWRGRIYNSLLAPSGKQRIYRGLYGTAHYQSVYRGGGHAIDIAHQVGVPAATTGLVGAALTPFWPGLAVLPVVSLCFLLLLAGIDADRAVPPRSLLRGRSRFKAGVVLLNLLQPLVRCWGRLRAAGSARRGLPPTAPLPGPARKARGGVLVLPEDRARVDLAAALISALQRSGLRALTPTGWEPYDARFIGSALIYGDLLTSGHPIGAFQVRIKRRLRVPRLVGVMAATAGVALVSAPLGLVASAGVLFSLVVGGWRTGPRVRRVVQEAAR